jgi:hypothetical protein
MPAGSVRPANQNGPTGNLTKPDNTANQFATVLLNTIERRGWDDERLENEAAPSTNVTQTIVGQRHLVASIQFFRGDAYTKAERLRALLQTANAITQLQAAGLGVIRVGQALNLTALVDTYWEERGQLEVELSLVTAEQASVATYGKFPITTETESQTNSTEVTTQ